MKKTIFVSMVIIAMAVMGLATAQDFVSGEMKGSDAPQVFKIGGDDPADDLFVKTMQPVPLSGIDSSVFESAFFMQKDWVFDTTSYSMTPSMQPVPLSGIDSSVFESAFFMQKDWVFDTTSYSMTPSMGAFAKNNPADGKPLVPAAKSASVGLVSLQKPGEDLT